jgi:diacylglycerol O-acyltransferase
MRRLTGTDSLFLSLETGAIAMHVGGLLLLDTTDAPDFSFERVRDLHARRIPRVPKLTWRLREVPLGLDRPSWTQAGELDIDRHLERVAVPAPGGPREIGGLIGSLMEQRLDRAHPLWKTWYLDGLPDGSAALFLVMHHCLMDGTSGASMAATLFDTEPDADPGPPAPYVAPGGRDPSGPEHLSRSLLHMAANPWKVPGLVAAGARRVAQIVPDVVGNGLPSVLRSPAPRASFNQAIGRHRRVAYTSLPLADFRTARQALGATVNDLIVAVCAGALERYLERIGEELPDKPFVVAVPVSMRVEGDDGELTNRVAAFPISVPTRTTDPLDRLHAITRGTERGKQLTARFAASRLPSVGDVASPFVLGAAMWAFTPLIPRVPVVVNTMVSTIRRPPVPLYVAGARLTAMYPTNMLAGNMGLDFTTISSGTQVDVGVTVDPELVPDPWLVADALPEALEELVRAATAV